jgi:two-component system CAI-1 autoinducer sensor kinase/phosphatase CqsS
MTAWAAENGLQKRWATRYKRSLERSNRYIHPHYRLLGWVAICFYPAFYVLLRVLYPEDFQGLAIRLGVALLSLPLVLHRSLPSSLQVHFPTYVYGLTTFGLPFVFGTILIVNGAETAQLGDTKVVWIAQYLVGLFLYVQLTSSVILATVGWVGATVACFIVVPVYVDTPNWEEVSRIFLLMLPTYFTAVFVGSITNRNKQAVDDAIVQAVSSVGSNIAHEMRTPLLSIKSRATLLSRYLPDLIDNYRDIPLENRLGGSISERHLQSLLRSPESLQLETEYANTVINMLLANAREVIVDPEVFERVSMSDLVGDAISRYPFSSSRERSLVRAKVVDDFCGYVPKQLVVHVLFNLIKNALYFVQQSRKGEVVISVCSNEGGTGGIVVVEDTGPGIPRENMKLVFQRFFSTSEGGKGSGIGLSYCKMVMEGIGGSIVCDSEPGLFTRFTLAFSGADAKSSEYHGSAL